MSYVQASSNAPPPASQLAANSTGSRMDTGESTAAELDATRMAYQQAYANPAQFGREFGTRRDGTGAEPVQPANMIPGGYNLSGPYPAKYSIPTPAKERMTARQALRDEAGQKKNGATIMDGISDEEVDYLLGMKRQAKLADYDRYVSTLVDPRQPGQLRWLYEVYPDFVHRRIAQVQQDFDFAIKNKLIDMWGINSKEDLDFKFQVDQGEIDGPRLYRPPPAYDTMYQAGMLAPWYYARKETTAGVNLPFTSAQDGARPPYQNAWTLADQTRIRGAETLQPLSQGRGYNELANAMYGNEFSSGTDGRAYSDTTRAARTMGERAYAQQAPPGPHIMLGDSVVPATTGNAQLRGNFSPA